MRIPQKPMAEAADGAEAAGTPRSGTVTAMAAARAEGFGSGVRRRRRATSRWQL